MANLWQKCCIKSCVKWENEGKKTWLQFASVEQQFSIVIL